MFLALQAQGYPGSYDRVVVYVGQWRKEQEATPKRQAYMPIQFRSGKAFQFNWSCEYAFIGGLRKRLEMAHIKLANSRAFPTPCKPTRCCLTPMPVTLPPSAAPTTT